MDVEWRIIEGFPRYSVSSTGSVRNNITGKILKTSKNKIGYLYKENNNVNNLLWVTYRENTNNPPTLRITSSRVGKEPKADVQLLRDKLSFSGGCMPRYCLGKRKTYRGYNWRFRYDFKRLSICIFRRHIEQGK